MNSSSSSTSCSCFPSDYCRSVVCDSSRNTNCAMLGDTIIQSIDEKLQPPQQSPVNEDKKGRRQQSNAENENSIAAELKKMNVIGTVGQQKPIKNSTLMLSLSSQSKEGTQSVAEQDKSLDLVDQDQLQLCQRQLSQLKLQSALQERSLNTSVSSCQAVSEKGSSIGDQQGKECKVEGSENLLLLAGFTESKESCQLEKQLTGQIFQEEQDGNLSIHPADGDDNGKIVVVAVTIPALNIIHLEAQNEENSNIHNDFTASSENHMQNDDVACANSDSQSHLDELGKTQIIIDDVAVEEGQVADSQKDKLIQICDSNSQIKDAKQEHKEQIPLKLNDLETSKETVKDNDIIIEVVSLRNEADAEQAEDSLIKNVVSLENQKDVRTQEDTQDVRGQLKEGEMNQSSNQPSTELEGGASHSVSESTSIHSTTLDLQQESESEEPQNLETACVNEKQTDHIDHEIDVKHSRQDPSQSVDQSVGMQNPSHLSSSEMLSNAEETAMNAGEQKEMQLISHEANIIREDRNLLTGITTIKQKEKQQDNINNVIDIPTSSEDETAGNITALTSSDEVSQEILKTFNNGSDKNTENLIEQINSIIEKENNTTEAGQASQSVARDEETAAVTEMDWQFVDGMDDLIEEISGQLQNEGYVSTAMIDSDNVMITSEEEEIIKKILRDVEDEGQEQITANYQRDIHEREAASMEYLLECVKIISEAERDLESLQKCMLKEQQTLQEIQALAMKQIGSKTKEQLEKEKQKRFQEQQQQTGNYCDEERQQMSSGNQKVKNTQQKQPQPQNGNVRDILAVSLENIRFGVVFPGNIFEDAVEISNKSNDTIFLKAVGLCLNPEFDSHGEYVYSIRKTTNYDYNEKLTVQLSPQSTVKIHVALKVPNIHAATILKGSFAVTIAGYDTYISIPITAQVEIPKIVCTRQLFHSSSEHKIIRLAIRKSKKSDCKIPFKNVSNHQIQIEPTWLDDQQMVQLISSSSGLVSKVKQLSPFNLILQPALFTVPPKGFFMMQCILKPNSAYKEFTEKRAQENDKSALLIKNVLLLKIVNSSIILHFPLSLEIAL